MTTETSMATTRRKIRVLGSDVDALRLPEAVEAVLKLMKDCDPEAGVPTAGQFVVTPNLDHAVMLQKNEKLRAAYQDAALVLADGMPLIWAARLFRRPLPERVAGSDLGPAVLDAAPAGTKLFLLGASEESSQKAAEKIESTYPHVRVAGRLSPPFGFENSEEWSDKIVTAIRESGATLVWVGLGAPKQELWIHAHAHRLPGTVSLCIGATIDFMAGTVARAPEWAQKSGLEWAHRIMTNPRRLASRYAKDALYFPSLLAKDAAHALKRK